jgi:hypothetical protein
MESVSGNPSRATNSPVDMLVASQPSRNSLYSLLDKIQLACTVLQFPTSIYSAWTLKDANDGSQVLYHFLFMCLHYSNLEWSLLDSLQWKNQQCFCGQMLAQHQLTYFGNRQCPPRLRTRLIVRSIVLVGLLLTLKRVLRKKRPVMSFTHILGIITAFASVLLNHRMSQ